MGGRIPIVTAADDHSRGATFKLGAFSRLHPTSCVLLPDSVKAHAGQGVLIVVDYVRTGETTRLIRQQLRDWGFTSDDVKVAAVVATRVSLAASRGPEFYDEAVDRIWFNFPWGRAV
jgi:hypothetical protein